MVKLFNYVAVLAVLVLLMAPSVLAVTITVKTNKYHFHNTITRILHPDSGNELKTIYPVFDDAGEASAEFDTSLQQLSFLIIVKHPLTKKIVFNERFDNIDVLSETIVEIDNLSEIAEAAVEEPEGDEDGVEKIVETGDGVVAEETGEDIEKIVEETTEEELADLVEVVVEESSSSGRGKITGYLISEETGKLSKGVYYIAGAILLLVVILFLVVKSRKSLLPPHVRGKIPLVPVRNKESNSYVEDELRDAQRLLKEARAEIKDVKRRRSEMGRAEEEFRMAKERLEKLQGKGESDSDIEDIKRGVEND